MQTDIARVVLVDIDEIVFDSPELMALLILILGVIAYLQSKLGPGDDWIETLKLKIYLILDPILSKHGFELIRKKGIEEYIYSTHITPDEVEEVLMSCGYERNVAANKKYRELPDGSKQYEVGSMKYRYPDSDQQHHVYIFPGQYYVCDIYGHKETDWQEDPEGHMEDPQIDGDPDEILKDCLDEAEVEYEKDKVFIEQYS